MTPTQGLIAGLFIAFACGVYVGRDQREPARDIPSNLDLASCLQAEKSSKAEAAVLQGVAMKALERCGTEREAH